jgi:hypothetical protein
LIKNTEASIYSALRNSLIEKDSSFDLDLPLPLEDRVTYSLLHHEEFISAISQLDLPGDDRICFLYMNGDRIYIERGNNLQVYSLSDISSPIAIYPLVGGCCSGILTENHLYLGGIGKLHIFEVTTSIIQPLMMLRVIATASTTKKILRVDHELLLGEHDGYF